MNFEPMFKPKTMAVIGVSTGPGLIVTTRTSVPRSRPRRPSTLGVGKFMC